MGGAGEFDFQAGDVRVELEDGGAQGFVVVLEAGFELGDAVEEVTGDGGRHVVRRCTIEENGRFISMLESGFRV